MTEPKKEKCEACYGSGYINFWTDDGHISMRTCRRCDGYGYINVEPQTNEEYLKSCDTEQLAEWIAHQTMIALLENQNNHSLRMTYPAYWVEWLKQPHQEE